jgi:hypothetical protein
MDKTYGNVYNKSEVARSWICYLAARKKSYKGMDRVNGKERRKREKKRAGRERRITKEYYSVSLFRIDEENKEKLKIYKAWKGVARTGATAK